MGLKAAEIISIRSPEISRWTRQRKKKDLADSKARHAKEKAEYMANDADLSKAISALGGAIDAMVNTGGTRPTLLTVKKVVEKNLALAESLKIVTNGAHWGEVTAFLEVDPNDPNYKYHSQGI